MFEDILNSPDSSGIVPETLAKIKVVGVGGRRRCCFPKRRTAFRLVKN